ERAIEMLQFPDEDSQRPPIGRDMVNRSRENAIRAAELKQTDAYRGLPLQVETVTVLLNQSGAQLLALISGSEIRQIDARDGDGRGLRYDLLRSTVDRRETTPEHAVALRDFLQRALQCRDVEGAVHSHRKRQVLSHAFGKQAIEEPYSLLRE